MRRLGRPRRSVVAALVVAGVFLTAFTLLQRVQGAAPGGTAVLVATRDIAAGEIITREMVRVQIAPAGAPLGTDPALASDLPRVLGSRARAAILAGEPLARARLAGPGLAGSGVVNALALPPGYARYTVPVGPLTTPLPGLAAGDYVEILAALPQSPASPAITTTVQPIDAHALVVFVQDQPPALTLAVPRRELAVLAWLRGQGAALSFALVGTADRGGDLRGLGLREFRRLYHVPSA